MPVLWFDHSCLCKQSAKITAGLQIKCMIKAFVAHWHHHIAFDIIWHLPMSQNNELRINTSSHYWHSDNFKFNLSVTQKVTWKGVIFHNVFWLNICGTYLFLQCLNNIFFDVFLFLFFIMLFSFINPSEEPSSGVLTHPIHNHQTIQSHSIYRALVSNTIMTVCDVLLK